MKRATTTNLKLASLTVAIAAAAFLASCSGDDGAVGPAGKDGTNGTNGTNGVGFEEAISRGNVLIILDGKRPDGLAFKDTVNFRFAPGSPRYSSFQSYSDDYNYTDTYIKRYQGWDQSGDPYNEDYTTGTLYSWTTVGLDANVLKYQYLNFEFDHVYIEFPAENKFFDLDFESYISNYVDSETGQWETYYSYNFGDSTITSFTNAITNGAFKYNIGFTVPADNNSTGYDLKVTAIGDLTLEQQMYNPNQGGRLASNRTAAPEPKKVEKAVMKSMN